MAKIKQIKIRPTLASRWELYTGGKPQSYELPEGVVLQTEDLDPGAEVICADCGRTVRFDYTRPSPVISHRRKTYIRYMVCQGCYFKEKDIHRRIMEKLMAAGG